MRVISQNGELDFPYEQIVVFRNENIVQCRFANVKESVNVLGEYGAQERAEKAMEMLREAYAGKPLIFQNVDIDIEEFEKVKSKFEYILLIRSDDNTSSITEINERVFQFPQDIEVAV